MKTVRIFVSSPGDVGAEREKAREIFQRLQAEFSGQLEVTPYFWEHEPMRADTDFQTQIEPPSRFDLFVCLLWARLGSRLHPALHRKPDGTEYASGTEYELLDALEGFRRSNAPEVLIYKRRGDPIIPAKPRELREQILAQYDALESFFTRLTESDGHFVVGSNSYAGLEEFETKFEAHMRKLLVRFLPEGVKGAHAVPRSWTTGSPFRGLRPFDFEHAAVFFGRTRAVDEVLAALKEQAFDERAFVLVFGGSGVGKSSLVRAGIVPWLIKPGVIDGVGLWRRAIMRPNEVNDGDLFDALATALLRPEGLPEISSDGTSSSQVAAMLRDNPTSVGMLIKGALSQAAREIQMAEKLEKQPRALFVLVVDQLEELFTVERLASQREGFLRAIDVLARSGFVWVLATLRSDFYQRCEESPLLMKLKQGNGQYHLQPPDEVQLGQMIRLPAAAAGLLFQEDHKSGERLDDLLRDAGTKSPAALPLLEFALEELYQMREVEAGLLKLESYHALGGVEGAVGRRAEESFQKAGAAARENFDLVFRELVTIGTGQGQAAVRRRARKADVEKNAGSRDLVDQLVADRLLVADRTEEGVLVIGLAHEAILQSWPRLVQWIEENRQSLASRAQVAGDAARWLENARNDDYLYPRGLRLEKARKLLSQDFLSAPEREFVEASARKVEESTRFRMRRLKQLAAGFALLALLAIAAGAFAWKKKRDAVVAQEVAESEKLSAQKNLSRSDFFQAVRRLEEHNAGSALAYLARSVRTDATNKASFDLICNVLLHRPWALPIAHTISLPVPILSASFSEDAQKVVTISPNNTIGLWNTQTGTRLIPPIVLPNVPFSALLSPSGDSVLVACYDYSVQLWDSQTGQPRGPVMAHHDGLESALFSRDGSKIVTSSGDKVYFWDSRTSKQLRPPLQIGGEGQVNYAAFNPAGDQVVIATWEAARAWDLATSKPLGPPIPHPGVIKYVGFTPDGTKVVTTTWDNEIRVWNIDNAQPVTAPMRHDDYVAAPVFSRDGLRIMTASNDHTVRIWDAETGEPFVHPMSHDAAVLAAVFTPDEHTVITLKGDYDGPGSISSWDIRNRGVRPEPMWHRDSIASVKFSPDGQDVVSGSKDGTARVWEVKSAQPVTPPMQHEDAVQSAVFSPDGTRVATASLDNTVKLWDAKSGNAIGEPMRHEDAVTFVAFSPDGERIVSGSTDKTARIFDAHSGKVLSGPFQHKEAVTSVMFSPDGHRVLTSCADNSARVWDAQNGKELFSPMRHEIALEGGHENGVVAASFSPDGQEIVTAGKDNTARLWSAQTGARVGLPMRHDAYVTSAVFSSDGRRVLTAACEFGRPGTARIWEATSGHPLIEPMRHGDGVTSAVFDSGDRRVLTASFDKTVRVWDAETGKALSDPLGHEQLVTSAAFSPDGRQVVTGSEDGAVRVWEMFDDNPLFRKGAADLAEAVGGIRLNERGVPEAVAPDGLEKFRKNWTAAAGDSAGDPVIKWFFADSATRPIAPSLSISRSAFVEHRVREGTPASLQEAYRMDPGNPLIVVSLAGQSEDPRRALFLCEYVEARAGDDAEIWSKTAQVLQKHGKTGAAVTAIDRAIALQPGNGTYTAIKNEMAATH